MFPKNWFFALERENSQELFKNNLQRFGLLADAPSDKNPDGLPIGVTTALSRDLQFANEEMIGVNCAACHSTQFQMNGHVVLHADGAPNLFNLGQFYSELVRAAQATIRTPDKLWRFVSRLSNNAASTKEGLGAFTRRLEMLISIAGYDSLGTKPGFGRVDAFGTARNTFFPDAAKPNTAPVSYPHLWRFGSVDWLNWDANTLSITERNVAHTISILMIYDPHTLESSLTIRNIERLESLGREIVPPKWPSAFGNIKMELAETGKSIFESTCVGCHQRVAESERITDAKAPRFSPAAIGTDATRAVNFAVPVHGESFDSALSKSLKELVRKAGGTVAPENQWRVTGEYVARPLVAPWATAPYLHNNSVRTLEQLLTPESEREPFFFVGSREYDPNGLGFKSIDDGRTFKFEVSSPRNSNRGHSGPKFGTDLTAQERSALLEYIKGL